MNARRATARLLADWKRHVAEHGPIEPPPFATREDDRIPAVSGEDLEAMALAAAHGNDDVMWQLCDAADLALLDPGPAGLPVLRFAPRAGLAAIGDRLPSETLWISSPRHSGVLRLVPVRPDLVAVRWAASDEQPEEMSGEGRDEQPGEGGGTPR
jgi:hypothetical protein